MKYEHTHQEYGPTSPMRRGTFRSLGNDPSSPGFPSLSFSPPQRSDRGSQTTHIAGNLELSTNTKLRSSLLRDFDGFDDAVGVAFPVESPLIQAASTERGKHASKGDLEMVNSRHRSEMTHLGIIIRGMRIEKSNVESDSSQGNRTLPVRL